MGRVRVKYLGYLADYAGAREEEVPVRGGERILEIVKIPPGVDPEELIFLRNGLPAKPSETVKPGDTIAVMPHISGG